MKLLDWQTFKGLPKLLATPPAEPPQQAERIVAMQLHIVLPVKVGVIAVALYYLFYAGWLSEEMTVRWVVQEVLQRFFQVYVGCNALAAGVLFFWRRFRPGIFQWLAFSLGLLDGLFVAELMILTGGFDSSIYWLFPGLIVLNALSIPLATPQIALNLLLSLFYLGAGSLYANIPDPTSGSLPPIAFRAAITNLSGSLPVTNRIPRTTRPIRVSDLPYSSVPPDIANGPDLSRVLSLWLLTACCYGVQVLAERQRQTLEEAREFAMREGQLHSAGRLAAEFAHQIKNPLAVINNAAFSLKRTMRDARAEVTQQIGIIQEEVARADQVITQIMGYAQLSEGHVEKLDVSEEIERSIAQVFPAAVPTAIRLHRQFGHHLPPLLMQRGHLSEICVNLLKNAREALGENGNVYITAHRLRDHTVEISVRDDGPGIAPDKIGRIFEAYYTTKERGTGLGLVIVKHNVELYGGAVQVESRLGNGAKFTIIIPAKSQMKPAP
ncbi:MAG TPA: HAMP domain-containing sensor histidine kinase [Candidatus Acidoferrum sp.]|nr:HAMP domain-containing sensor histidine kinase [Candidatus Acidoferrum sp.]